ncbi:glutamine-synthetase adenylyltransferase [Hydrogenobacter thermophilus]|uniref:[protein-PII] uridylyltransferase family protein n=1 Tax=Hydrogenobacter thermophilus TaxID=940 RepID=UPI0030F7EB0F
MFPVEWWQLAERRLVNPQRAKESLEELLKRHRNPQTLINYLNQRRFTLLLELLDHSDCIRKFLINHPEDFQNTIPGLWYVTKRKEDYLKELRELITDSLPEDEFSKRLAYYRHRELMRILSKEILKTAKLEDLLVEYSHLPDAMLELAYERAFREFSEFYGKPIEENNREATGCVVALGKLGSFELNYYSDIDIMFLHSSDKGFAGKLSLNEFFSKVFQKVFTLMSNVTPEGKPYEVDLDLRPFGRSGPISMSLRSAELYYESYGRIWERFALLRARFSAGDEDLYQSFERDVRIPFVFKRSVDYKIIEEVQFIKAQILAQAKRQTYEAVNIKLCEGGIRELEFAVQSLVLLLGGKFPFLRESNTFKAIWRLNQKGVFSNEEAKFLEEAYEFLRKIEHRVQTYRCIQTQKLTKEDIPIIAKMMGYEPEEFEKKIGIYTKGVSNIFKSVIPSGEEKEPEPIQQAILTEDFVHAKEILSKLGFKNPVRTYNILLSYVHGREGINLSNYERKKLLEMLPKIVSYMSASPDPDETLNNFDKFFSNPTGRKVILSPSKEDVIKILCKVFSLSSYLSTLVSRNPDLVEDLLTLYQDFPEESLLQEEFEKYESTLKLSLENTFRRFKKVWEVRISLVYLAKKDDKYAKLKDFFKSLTDLADFIMKKLWEKLDLFRENMTLIALGKYGSSELSIGSDLDLVFVGRDHRDERVSLVQNFIRFLTTHTREGYLYDVDFRLRPMGTKGQLIPSLDFYKEYFSKYARTWERLAWTRCRYIAGDQDLYDHFELILENFLFDKPMGKEQKEDIKTIRSALEAQAKKGAETIDLKFAPGGIIDGEFLAQYFIILERMREPSMIKAYEKLVEKHPILKKAYEHYMFLRLVETRLRLSKERGTSVLSAQDITRVANSLSMDRDEFLEDLKLRMKDMREIFLEVFE